MAAGWSSVETSRALKASARAGAFALARRKASRLGFADTGATWAGGGVGGLGRLFFLF